MGAASAGQRGAGDAALNPASPSWEGSAVRDEAAAAALGLTARQASGSAGSSAGRRRGDVAATFKSLGGAFKGMAKDVASASRSQLKSLAGGRAQQPLMAAVAGISDGSHQGACAWGGCCARAETCPPFRSLSPLLCLTPLPTAHLPLLITLGRL